MGSDAFQMVASATAPLKDRINKALKIATEDGGIDGDHHKMWVIDQMVRALTTEDEYQRFVADHNSGDEGPKAYQWDEGIAP